MASITINSSSGIDLSDKTLHVGNFVASTQTTTSTDLKYIDGWEIIAGGSFSPILGMVNSLAGVVTSFQGFDPAHNLIFSATSAEMAIGDFIAYSGVLNSTSGFNSLISLFLQNEDSASAGRNSLTGGTGNDTFHIAEKLQDGIMWMYNLTVNGGDGIDTVRFDSTLEVLDVKKNVSDVSVNNGAFAVTLENVERLQFSDSKMVAFDVDAMGHAVQAMEFIGVVAPNLLDDASTRGTIISLFDQGQTMESLSRLALDLGLLPTMSNVTLANTVYHNVLGGTATLEMTNALVSYIESHGQANFVATVADLHLNVDLVGLHQTGVEYVI